MINILGTDYLDATATIDTKGILIVTVSALE